MDVCRWSFEPVSEALANQCIEEFLMLIIIILGVDLGLDEIEVLFVLWRQVMDIVVELEGFLVLADLGEGLRG